MRRKEYEMRNWNEFDKFESVIDKYMPMMGEGETMASQACTAVNKLVYKWYNDGDVFDNTYMLEGWCNDLSTYANWLHKHIEPARLILERIAKCYSGGEYEELLYDLCETCLDTDELEKLNKHEKVGSIYKEQGVFEFEEPVDEWDEEDEW